MVENIRFWGQSSTNATPIHDFGQVSLCLLICKIRIKISTLQESYKKYMYILIGMISTHVLMYTCGCVYTCVYTYDIHTQ